MIQSIQLTGIGIILCGVLAHLINWRIVPGKRNRRNRIFSAGNITVIGVVANIHTGRCAAGDAYTGGLAASRARALGGHIAVVGIVGDLGTVCPAIESQDASNLIIIRFSLCTDLCIVGAAVDHDIALGVQLAGNGIVSLDIQLEFEGPGTGVFNLYLTVSRIAGFPLVIAEQGSRAIGYFFPFIFSAL